jgi:hypothetical protein
LSVLVNHWQPPAAQRRNYSLALVGVRPHATSTIALKSLVSRLAPPITPSTSGVSRIAHAAGPYRTAMEDRDQPRSSLEPSFQRRVQTCEHLDDPVSRRHRARSDCPLRGQGDRGSRAGRHVGHPTRPVPTVVHPSSMIRDPTWRICERQFGCGLSV